MLTPPTAPRSLRPFPPPRPWPLHVVYELPDPVYDHLVEVCRRCQDDDRKPLVSLFNGESQSVLVTVLDLRECGRLEFPSAVYPPGTEFYDLVLELPTLRQFLTDTGYPL